MELSESLVAARLDEERKHNIVLPLDLRTVLAASQDAHMQTMRRLQIGKPPHKAATGGTALLLARGSFLDSSFTVLATDDTNMLSETLRVLSESFARGMTDSEDFVRAALALDMKHMKHLCPQTQKAVRAARGFYLSAFTAFQDALEGSSSDVEEALNDAMFAYPTAFGMWMALTSTSVKETSAKLVNTADSDISMCAITELESTSCGWLDFVARSITDSETAIDAPSAFTTLLSAEPSCIGLSMGLEFASFTTCKSAFAAWLVQHPRALYHLLAFSGNDSRSINLAVAVHVSALSDLRKVLESAFPALAKCVKASVFAAFQKQLFTPIDAAHLAWFTM